MSTLGEGEGDERALRTLPPKSAHQRGASKGLAGAGAHTRTCPDVLLFPRADLRASAGALRKLRWGEGTCEALRFGELFTGIERNG